MENAQNIPFYNAIFQTVKEATRQTAKQMLNEMDIDGIVNRIQSYPAKIKTQQNIINQAQRSLDEAKMELETIKADIVTEINFAINGQGKPIFSNEKAREAEFILKAKNSTEYQVAMAEYHNAEDNYNTAKFTLDQLYNEFSAQKSILAALTAKINFLAGI